MRNVLKLAGVLAMAGLSLTAADPFLGAWKLDVGKSRTNAKTPPPPPKSLVATIAQQGDERRVSTEVTLANGTTQKVEHVYKCDGQDYPRFKGAAPGDTMSCSRIDEFTEENTSKRDGKVTIFARRVVSPDGQTMTSTATGKGADGTVVETVSVYEKLP